MTSLSHLRDKVGHIIEEGMLVVKPYTSGRSAMLELREVHIRNGNIYLDDSKVPIQYPERLLVVEDIRHRLKPE